jgi:hypothetical protein
MPDVVSLQPPNATPYVLALSEALAVAAGLPTAEFDTLWNPRTCPAAVLPFLAQASGVLLWKTSWSEAKKRWVIERTIALKRRRGSELSFAEHLSFVDAQLVRMRTPPQRAVARVTRTPAERAAWARRFAELRIRTINIRHHRRGRLVVGQCWGGEHRAAGVSTSDLYAGLRASLVVDGEESDVTLRILDDAPALQLQAAVTTQRTLSTLGKPIGRQRLVPRGSEASSSVYSFQPGDLVRETLAPGSAPVEIAPASVRQGLSLPPTVVAGAPIGGRRRVVRASRAAQGQYDSYRLYDAARARSSLARPPGSFVAGSTRLGQPAFELHLDVDMKRHRPGRRAFPLSWRGVLRAHDPQPMTEVLAAARAAKLGRDRVLVRTNLYRPIAVGDGLPLDGSYRLGQIVRSL